MSVIKIAAATVNQTPLDWEGNLRNIKNCVEEAKRQDVELLCFPELSLTGYGSEDLFLSNWYIQKAFDCLKKLIPFSKGITLIIGTPAPLHGKTYNCMAIIENEQVIS